MKLTSAIALILALSASCIGTVQSAGMKDMDMKGMSNKPHTSGTEAITYKTTAVVKAVDIAKGRVKLALEPIRSLTWPAMTKEFSVEKPALFDKLTVGKKVEVGFVLEGSDYVITVVK